MWSCRDASRGCSSALRRATSPPGAACADSYATFREDRSRRSSRGNGMRWRRSSRSWARVRRARSSRTSPWTGATPSNRTRGSMSVTDLHPAAHWRPEGGAVRCGLCPHLCLIPEEKRGICKVRENRGGRLFAITYGKVSAVQFDPAEKKPRYHFHPGKPILSIGSVGCNFHCGFCQNHHLVECAVPLAPVPIPDLVRAARREGAVGISYTYNEPLIWFEFVMDCAREFRKAGMANVLV